VEAATARLKHPNIVIIYDAGEHDGQQFFAMELVAGGSLKEMLNGGPLPCQEAAELVEVLARAVHYAHQHGIIHRDLKPGNILFDEDNTPKVTDFGLAKRLDVGTAMTATRVVMGTPQYMSPEQAEGESEPWGRRRMCTVWEPCSTNA
jgi:serine/threonine-protein kinase